MRTEDLVAFGLVPSVLAAARGTGLDELLPLQEQAVRAGVLQSVAEIGERGERGQPGAPGFLLSGPSGSGKTALFDLCAAHAAHSGQRVLLALPTRAAASAALVRLRAGYGSLGLSIGAPQEAADAGGEAAHEPERLDVAVTDFLTAARLAAPDRPGALPFLSTVDVALFDALERPLAPAAGSALELVLALLAARARPIRLLLSVGEGGPAAELVAGLELELVQTSARPGELRIGVLLDSLFTYRSSRELLPAGSAAESAAESATAPPLGEERIGEPRTDEVPAALRAAIELCERGEPVLLIAPSEATAQRYAEQAAALLAASGPAPAAAALTELQRTASGRARELLTQTLRYGVGLLVPGLLPPQRAVLRTALRAGELRLLCAPPEPVLDEDLRLRNVIVASPQVLRRPERGGSPVRMALGPGELQQLAGRCARATSFLGGSGRALFVAHDRMQAEDLKRALWSPAPVSPLLPSRGAGLRGQPLAERVLSLLGAAPERDPRALLTLPQGADRPESPPAVRRALDDAIDAALHELARQGLATADEPPVLTPSGAVAVRHGLAARSAARLVRWAEAARGAPWTDLEALLVVSLYPEAGPLALSEPLPLHPSELETQEHPIEALARVAAEGATERPLFRWLAGHQAALTLDQIRAIKRALLLSDWADRHDGETMEARYGTWLGTLQRAAASATREIAALTEICEARGWSQTALRRLRRLRERLARPQVPASGPVERARSVIAIRAALRAGAALTPAGAAEHVAPPGLQPKSS
ncbi:MAG: hypothetical protein U1A78_32370 [Polyangia bacterium]